MDKLIAGYRRFRETSWPDRRKVFESLAAAGQQPRAMVIACVDSRVDPTMIFDAGPGELVIVRNVANLVPPYAPDRAYHGTSAAVEMGVRVLGISQIIVLGHGMCGGVQALLSGAPEGASDFVGPWMQIAESARRKALHYTLPAKRQKCCEEEVVKLSLANLMTFPWIRESVEAGTLQLRGAWFAIHSGCLEMLQPDGSFAKAEEENDQ